MDWVWAILLLVVCMFAVAISFARLPGTWLILISATVYSWLHDWATPGLWALVGLGIVAVIAELLEMAASAVAVQRSGASRRAMWGALIGGMLGMFVFSIPLPVIGTLIGGALGCFVGAVIGEMSSRDELGHVAKVGAFAAIGQITGVLLKMMFTFVMFATVLVSVIMERWSAIAQL